MKRNDAFPKKYLCKEDVLQPLTATISNVNHQEIGSGDETEVKVVMEFNGDTKPMVLNGTNWDTLETAFGEDSDAWIGKTVTLYNDPNVMYGGKKTGGVRVRVDRVLSPAEKWAAFKKDVPFTEEHVMKALGCIKPSEWIAQEQGRTIEHAIELVRAAVNAAF
jgi:hypothetical protein